MRSPIVMSALAALGLCSQACTHVSTCSRAEDSLTVPLGGHDGGAVEGNVYHSAPYGGPYAYFPPFRTITFEHGLHALPYDFQFWLAFTPSGTLAPSAGNMTELRAVTDGGPPALNDQTISVYNNTCSEFYLWVVVEKASGEGTDAASEADSGADEEASAGARGL